MKRWHILAISLWAAALAGQPAFEDFLVVPMVPNRTHRGATGSIIALKDGSLLFAHANPEHWTVNTRSGVVARFSRDRGRTWGDPFVMQKNVGRYATIQPVLHS